MTLNQERMIKAHALWLRGEGGARADLSGAKLAGAKLAGAKLAGADLNRAKLAGADLNRADLSGAILLAADLSGADLNRADLRRAELRRADLTGAILLAADLSGADFSGAILLGADLRRAELRDANLIGANLIRTGLMYAHAGWEGHGERGRTLLGVVIHGEIVLQCGCFAGSVSDLEAYIAEGDPELAESRTLAMRIVVGLLLFGPREDVS